MGLDKFFIQLDSSSGPFYHPGEEISGRVILCLSQSTTVTLELVVRFFGEAHTNWEENGVWFVGHETFFDISLKLFGDGITLKPIPLGENIFPFAFHVPTKFPLPGGVELEDGFVRYGLEARLRKPWYLFDPKTDLVPIKILPLSIDSNGNWEGSNLTEVSENGTGESSCSSGNKCLLESHTAKKSYVPGETITHNLKVTNRTPHPTPPLSVSLQRNWILKGFNEKGESSCKIDSTTLMKVVDQGVQPGESTKCSATFFVPLASPLSFSGCDIVQVDYCIRVFPLEDNWSNKLNRAEVDLLHPIIVGPSLIAGNDEGVLLRKSMNLSTNSKFT